MRRPRNLNDYVSVEIAIQNLQALVDDLRRRHKNSKPGYLMRWDIKISQWHPDWAKAAPQPDESVQP